MMGRTSSYGSSDHDGAIDLVDGIYSWITAGHKPNTLIHSTNTNTPPRGSQIITYTWQRAKPLGRIWRYLGVHTPTCRNDWSFYSEHIRLMYGSFGTGHDVLLSRSILVNHTHSLERYGEPQWAVGKRKVRVACDCERGSIFTYFIRPRKER